MDTFTVPQTAKVLGLTVKRIRQMIKEGKIKQYGVNPIRLKQVDVIALRTKRAEQGKTPKGKPTQAENLATILDSLNETFRTQLELLAASNQRNEENLIGRINALEGEIEFLRRRRPWYMRSKKEK